MDIFDYSIHGLEIELNEEENLFIFFMNYKDSNIGTIEVYEKPNKTIKITNQNVIYGMAKHGIEFPQKEIEFLNKFIEKEFKKINLKLKEYMNNILEKMKYDDSVEIDFFEKNITIYMDEFQMNYSNLKDQYKILTSFENGIIKIKNKTGKSFILKVENSLKMNNKTRFKLLYPKGQ